MSVEDRRKRLNDLKSRTQCADCGKTGHWRGDRLCPMFNKSNKAHVMGVNIKKDYGMHN